MDAMSTRRRLAPHGMKLGLALTVLLACGAVAAYAADPPTVPSGGPAAGPGGSLREDQVTDDTVENSIRRAVEWLATVTQVHTCGMSCVWVCARRVESSRRIC